MRNGSVSTGVTPGANTACCKLEFSVRPIQALETATTFGRTRQEAKMWCSIMLVAALCSLSENVARIESCPERQNPNPNCRSFLRLIWPILPWHDSRVLSWPCSLEFGPSRSRSRSTLRPWPHIETVSSGGSSVASFSKNSSVKEMIGGFTAWEWQNRTSAIDL
jgi:hypothetical protein